MTQFARAFREGASAGRPGSPIRFTASTSGIKRDGFDLNPRDFDLERYRKNPVFLWAHNFTGSQLPIGRAAVAVETDRLVADVVFDQADDFARQVERKYRDGFLSAVSISWDTIKTPRGPKHELLEISGVPVPMDPDALMERERAGLADLRRSIDSVLALPTARPWRLDPGGSTPGVKAGRQVPITLDDPRAVGLARSIRDDLIRLENKRLEAKIYDIIDRLIATQH